MVHDGGCAITWPQQNYTSKPSAQPVFLFGEEHAAPVPPFPIPQWPKVHVLIFLFDRYDLQVSTQCGRMQVIPNV
jgi:hypothetical protein